MVLRRAEIKVEAQSVGSMMGDNVSDLRGFEAAIARQRTVREVVAVEVIRVTYYQGMGTDDDPGREVRSYYTKAGELIGNDDPYNAPTLDQINGPDIVELESSLGVKLSPLAAAADALTHTTTKKRERKARGKKAKP
ncbi:hypothetical protein LCGC14_1123720 [marine sediment metagenome]|uniref:Uncharacterized protein n=1 Tax=marine sediment metagenome TaxID=412755 RepID=A0A0F9PLF1_9ZZZZ